REVRRRTDEALDALELHPYAAQHPYDLSPALRKLAALAGALALEPALLVLDEPTAGLDRAWRARVADAVREHAERGAALLVVTHDLAFAAETLERGIVLDRGRLACDEPLNRLLTSAERLKPLGLVPPPVAALSVALDLPGRAVRGGRAHRADPAARPARRRHGRPAAKPGARPAVRPAQSAGRPTGPGRLRHTARRRGRGRDSGHQRGRGPGAPACPAAAAS